MKKLNYISFCSLLIVLIIPCNCIKGQLDTHSEPDTSSVKQSVNDKNLFEAVIKNHVQNARIFLQNGADPNEISSTKNTALMYATEKGNLELMQLLVEYGADINATGFNSETPLFIAIFNNDFQAAKYLLEQGANPNIKDSFGVTPLIYAAATNQYQSADLLMFYEADAGITDANSNDPLLAAVTFENLETCDVLLQDGLSPDVQDEKGNTPVIVAVQHGRYDILDLLLDYDADVNIANTKNYTPLSYALTYNDVKATGMLIEHGADVNHLIEKGRNMMDVARITKNDSLINILKANGAKKSPGLIFSEFNLTYGNSFNRTDYLMQFRGGLTDIKYGFYFETGVDYRPFLLKIQTTIDDTLYQFRERRIGWSHTIGKYQNLYQSPNGFRFALYGALNGYLSFPSYLGSSSAPGLNYSIIPSAGAVISNNFIGMKVGADWYNFTNDLDKGLKFNLSVFFRIKYPQFQYDRKEIYWE